MRHAVVINEYSSVFDKKIIAILYRWSQEYRPYSDFSGLLIFFHTTYFILNYKYTSKLDYNLDFTSEV